MCLMNVITLEYHALGRKSKTFPLPSLIQTGVCVPPTDPSSREKAAYTSILRIFFFSFYTSFFWVVLRLRCFAQAFSSCGWWGLLSALVASLTAGRGLRARRPQ